jgi:hypothetical protein
MWKPRRRMSASDDQWWQDLQPGHAASGVSGKPDDEYYAAMLYLPNPESRSGWEAHGVERKRQDAPTRPMGFGREG